VRGDEVESSNWSGYAANGSTYTSVSANWVEPAGKCTTGTQLAGFWVGLDGYNTDTVEQTGDAIQCVKNKLTYYAWYEMYPSAPVDYSNPIKAGDDLSASVTYNGGSDYTLVFSDSTQGWSHTTHATLSGAERGSAEVIVEAPCCTSSGNPLALANFGTVSFTGANVDGAAIGNSSPTEIIMVDSHGHDKDTVSALSGGNSFSVTWKRKN
jgi:hypothetical protein